MKPRTAHLRVEQVAPHEWAVFVVVADGRWMIATEGTASEALAVARAKLADREHTTPEATA